MILTCPECGTQYVVKDDAIPAGGRRVRCAACRHSWHQDPPARDETLELGSAFAPELPEPADEPAPPPEVPTVWPEAPDERPFSPPEPEPADQLPGEHALADEEPSDYVPYAADSPPDEPVEEAPPGYAPVDEVAAEEEFSEPARVEPAYAEPAYAEPAAAAADVEERRGRMEFTPDVAEDDDFSPFARREPVEPRRRRPLLAILLLVVLIAAAAAFFWFFAPAEWKQRVGLASAAETPLQLMMTHSDRQQLASGNELLSVSGRVINPTDRQQPVPPITAELRSSAGQIVYRWTIAPPTRTLGPRASATFNSSELNVPAGGEELTISLGQPAA